MKKYVLEEYVLNGFNASSKAREDVSKFILDFGFKSIAKYDKSEVVSKLKKIILTLKIYYCLLIKLKKDDILFLQTSMRVLNIIFKIKKIRDFKIIYLIHDVFSIRYDDLEKHRNEIEQDINALNKCDYIICHNLKMKERLKNLGCKSVLITLGIFDYRVPDFNITREQDESIISIAFAGNISKSFFLKDLDIKVKFIQANIYGNPPTKFQNLVYKGVLSAEELPLKIKGMYGLIWEGDYLMQEKDNYLRYNNPHKTSLYIVSGLPVIVWSKAAVADFVVINKIGITIDTLDELEQKVYSISENEYKLMRSNCLNIRERLLKGYYLKQAINTAIKISVL